MQFNRIITGDFFPVRRICRDCVARPAQNNKFSLRIITASLRIKVYVVHMMALSPLIASANKAFSLEKNADSFFKVKVKPLAILAKPLTPLPIIYFLPANILTSPSIFALIRTEMSPLFSARPFFKNLPALPASHLYFRFIFYIILTSHKYRVAVSGTCLLGPAPSVPIFIPANRTFCPFANSPHHRIIFRHFTNHFFTIFSGARPRTKFLILPRLGVFLAAELTN